jgi:hypothetical protein
MVAEDITQAIHHAAKSGDVKRLHALSDRFPEQFAHEAKHGLLSLAHQAGQVDAILYLILEHHCLMGEEAALAQDRDLMGTRKAQIYRTLEVFADAARGQVSYQTHVEVSGIGCYDVTNAARQAAVSNMKDDAIHPTVLRAATNGTLQQWIMSLRTEEEKGGFTLSRHSGMMLKALEDNVYYLASYAPTTKPSTLEKPSGSLTL